MQNVNLRLLTVFAQRKGYPYRTAEHGQEAVAKYKAAALEQGDKPDVILMDINMPIMDGFQATKMIRQFEQQSGTDRATVIALTGLGNVAAQQESFASGMDLFLTKPVKLKELGNLLAKM
jgi:CheY-like chemotaxis protein